MNTTRAQSTAEDPNAPRSSYHYESRTSWEHDWAGPWEACACVALRCLLPSALARGQEPLTIVAKAAQIADAMIKEQRMRFAHPHPATGNGNGNGG